MQWHRQYQVRIAAEVARKRDERIGKELCQRELMPILERMHHRIDRECEIVQGACRIEHGRRTLTGCALGPRQPRQGATRARRCGTPRQLCNAVLAHSLATRIRSADEAILRRKDVGDALPQGEQIKRGV